MKVFCGVLILVLVAHLQCGGSCYTPPTVTVPSCHQHASDSKQPASQSNSPCSRQSVIAAKVAALDKTVLEFASLLPIPVAIKAPEATAVIFEIPKSPPSSPHTLASIGILRI
jgi:hypothetical protein